MRWQAIQRADGKFYSDQKELVASVGPQWVNTASAASLYWGNRGDLRLAELRGEGMEVELVPVEVTVRARSAGKGKPHGQLVKPTRGHVCASCGSLQVLDGHCTQCGSDMVKPT